MHVFYRWFWPPVCGCMHLPNTNWSEILLVAGGLFYFIFCQPPMKFDSRKIAGAVRTMFTLTPSQIRGILLLLPLLAVLGLVIGFANKPRFEKSFLELADSAAVAGDRHPHGPDRKDMQLLKSSSAQEQIDTAELFVFDPNTATLQEFCRLGLDVRTAANIVKYRERGKRFEIPEDFATCYGVTLDQYTRLEPYIRIGDEFRLKSTDNFSANSSARGNERETEPEFEDSVSDFDPNILDADGFVALGFSPRQADVIIRYRRSIGGFRTKDDFAKCYVVSDVMMERLGPHICMAEKDPHDSVSSDTLRIEINSADSTTLRRISGVGDVLVVRIMEYRERLGGFVSVEQLAEIRGMTPENLDRIAEQIRVDSCEIQKIDVNFAPQKTLVGQMGNHPYVTGEMLRKLLKNRQLKGGWRNIGEMVEQDIMTSEEAERLSPYLLLRSE